MQKRWVLTPKSESEEADNLQVALGVHPIFIQLLIHRGITTFEQAKSFFRPNLAHLHDPFLMQDMERAVNRIEQAIRSQEKILIYGDYDVDGTTAVTLVYGFFRSIHNTIVYYLPDRYTEGYGLSYKGIDYAKQEGVSLIITLDCGIKAHEQVDYANSLGIDVIIADHHLPGEDLPNAHAILDPKRSDCFYPYKELSGCGVGFKLIQAFLMKNNMDPKIAFEYLDLVAVSIASDIVPLTGENRVLTHFGLKKLNERPSVGLQALITLSGNKTGTFTISDILFQLGPRINAAGRIAHASNVVRLLLSKSAQEAAEFSKGIDIQNNQRKDFDLKITEEAMDLAASIGVETGRKSIVLYKRDWHRGVIGIVASRLVEKYHRPTIILTHAETHITGSARSIAGIDLYETLSSCSDLLNQFGGHYFAAGLTMEEENVQVFRDRFEEMVAARITDDMLLPVIKIESTLSLSDVDSKFCRILKQFEPFGPQQESPVFLSNGVCLIGAAQKVGENHLKMTVMQPGSASFTCIGFGLGHFVTKLNASQNCFNICFTIEENHWRNRKTLQLNIKDISF
jgi:single-stranded-DNA-specific exonuclease